MAPRQVKAKRYENYEIHEGREYRTTTGERVHERELDYFEDEVPANRFGLHDPEPPEIPVEDWRE